VVTPEIAHQFGMNGELAQMTPTHFRSLGGNAMAAAAATRAMSHQGKNKLVIEFNLGFPIYPSPGNRIKDFLPFWGLPGAPYWHLCHRLAFRRARQGP
jgi:hypothetical protein